MEKFYLKISWFKKFDEGACFRARKNFVLAAEFGIHARPATVLVQQVSQFNTDINLNYNNKVDNIKSIMCVMYLGIPKGAEIKISAKGTDAKQAHGALEGIMKKEGLTI